MGFTLPKLPKICMFSSGAKSSASGLADYPKKPSVKKLPTDIVPPEWLEPIEGYHIAWCRRRDTGAFGDCLVVGYHSNDFGSINSNGFAMIYVLDEDKDGSPPWMEKPFCRMKEIWREIHEDKKTHSITYEMSEDGRIYNDMMGFPSDDNIRDAIYDISAMYDEWKDFPNAPDWDTVRKLHEAQQAVDSMRVETKHGWMQKDIENMRKKIKETQEEIARVEKNLNEMYEKAADGMNLLEQHGIAVNLDDDEPKEPEKIAVDCDIASIYPNNTITYAGEANIVRMHDGSYVVTQKPLNHHPNAGDLVIDTGNGMTAVYLCGKWEVLNP